jgi:D-alanyl-D-alanine carboxypeptidase (penicillin-binding protein 5/6)
VLDGDTGQILYQKNAHLQLPQASTTKLMTALVAVEEGQLQALVQISSASTEIGGSSLYLEPGERLSVAQLLYGLLLVSGNDAADAVATNVAGSTESFVARMNAKAQALGLSDTHYANPHGLPEANHHSSAMDMAILGRSALANSLVARIAGTREFVLPGNSRTRFAARHLTNHNKLLGSFPGAWGGKTGYTTSAGHCFIGSARRNGRYVVEALLGSPKVWREAATLLNYGLDAYTTTQIAAPNAVFGMVDVIEGQDPRVAAVLPRAARVTLPLGESTAAIDHEAILSDSVEAPIRVGEYVGKLLIKRYGHTLTEFPLVAAAPVGRTPSLLIRVGSAILWFLFGSALSLGVFALLRVRQVRRKAQLRARRQRAATTTAAAARLVKTSHETSALSQLRH